MKKLAYVLTLLLSIPTFAQRVGIGTNNPDPSAALEIRATNRGFLPPRVALTATNDLTTVSSPIVGLVVYNTSALGTGIHAVAPGYYFFTGTTWQRFSNPGNQIGDMQYWNGQAWVPIPPGSNGTQLTLCQGVPQWGPCAAIVSTLNCAGATQNGSLAAGVAASNVSSSIPYTNGNGGVYAAQSIPSTGVIGLTATTQAGTIAAGNGSILYTISGTPASGGNANFLIQLGGQTCTLTRAVAFPPATVSSLNCAGVTQNGNLISGTSASNVTCTITYNGGNGGTYVSQSIPSTGVTGLTANLNAGNVNTGSGSLVFTIQGTPSSSGAANFALSFGGQTCSFSVQVVGPQPAYPAGTVHCGGVPTLVIDVVNPRTGRTWMDRNLGASRVATSSTDAQAFGDLYQWGRRADGHQCRNSFNTTAISPVDQPSYSSFIIAPNSPWDWRSPQNNNLWQGVNGTNNPCPTGYRLPTLAEIESERLSWSAQNTTGAFAAELKLTAAGNRNRTNGSISLLFGMYWTSSSNGFGDSHALEMGSDFGSTFFFNRANGLSVRCIKN